MSSIARKLVGVAAAVVVAAAAYLFFWPVPAEPVSWQATVPPGYTGVHAPNTRLAGLRTIGIGEEFGPEHMVIGPGGKLYAAMTSGSLLRMDPDGANQEVFANTGGRVLGFDFDAQGRMIAADAMKGLLVVGTDGSVSMLTDRVSADDPVRYANSIVVAPDGTIYFTDASGRFSPAEWGGTYPTSERARQNFYAEVQLGALSFRGKGECLALMVDFPEPRLFPVRCHLILSGLPAPFVGGVLTTNTITSSAPFGGDTQPPGYTQASIATIRLWRAR